MNSSSSKGILLESGTNEAEFLRFSIQQNFYGCNVSKVCQIILLDDKALTRLPEQPETILGAIYFRGTPVSVIDLGKTLSLPVNPERKNALLLVTEFNKKTVGFVIDEVQGIERITWDKFESLNSNSLFENNTSVIGTVDINGSLMMILDLEAIMSNIDPTMRIDSFANEITKEDTSTEKIKREKIRILYAEDSLLIQKILIKTLKEAGFQSISACTTGASALALITESGGAGAFDIILSDIEMPEMDGLTFCKKIRETKDGKEIPFIFFSSMINDQMKIKCERVGGNEAFSKPEVHKIVSAIDSLVRIKNI